MRCSLPDFSAVWAFGFWSLLGGSAVLRHGSTSIIKPSIKYTNVPLTVKPCLPCFGRTTMLLGPPELLCKGIPRSSHENTLSLSTLKMILPALAVSLTRPYPQVSEGGSLNKCSKSRSRTARKLESVLGSSALFDTFLHCIRNAPSTLSNESFSSTLQCINPPRTQTPNRRPCTDNPEP